MPLPPLPPIGRGIRRPATHRAAAPVDGPQGLVRQEGARLQDTGGPAICGRDGAPRGRPHSRHGALTAPLLGRQVGGGRDQPGVRTIAVAVDFPHAPLTDASCFLGAPVLRSCRFQSHAQRARVT